MIRSSDIGISQHEQSKLHVETSFHVEFFVDLAAVVACVGRLLQRLRYIRILERSSLSRSPV